MQRARPRRNLHPRVALLMAAPHGSETFTPRAREPRSVRSLLPQHANQRLTMGLLNVYRAPDGYVLALRPEAVPCPTFAWLGCVSPEVFEAPLRDQIERDLQDAAFVMLSAAQFFGVEVQPPVEPAMQDRNHPNE